MAVSLGPGGLVLDSIVMPNNTSGTILQVIQETKTNASSSSVGANSYAEFDTGFRLSITPKRSDSKILMMTSITAAQNTGSIRYKFQRSVGGASYVDCAALGDANSNHSRGHSVFMVEGDTNQAETTSFNFLDSPATTSSVVYRVLFGQDVTTTYHFNRSINYPNNFLGGTYASTMLALEIAQ